MPAQLHQSDPRILARRTLERNHRRLAAVLRPGMSVLDVGCGIGAITAGIAQATGPRGFVVGADRDAGLIAMAGREHGTANLVFVRAEATALPFRARFDVATAARTLQWIGDPARAIASMMEAVRRPGMLVILDYNQAANAWEPEPPAPFRRFYAAFLAWREAHGWDNWMADHLPPLFERAGLVQVETCIEDEVATRGEPDFEMQVLLWPQMMESVGPQLQVEGFLSQTGVMQAREAYQDWARTSLMKQVLCMRAVTGAVK